jgi:hypothetical protein
LNLGRNVTRNPPRTGEAATASKSTHQRLRCCEADIIGSGSEEFRRIGVAGWIDKPQILEHGGDRLAPDLDHALTGCGHG